MMYKASSLQIARQTATVYKFSRRRQWFLFSLCLPSNWVQHLYCSAKISQVVHGVNYLVAPDLVVPGRLEALLPRSCQSRTYFAGILYQKRERKCYSLLLYGLFLH